MEKHIRILGILNIVLGILGALAALTILIFFGGIAGLVSHLAVTEPDAQIAAPILGLVGAALSLFLLLVSLPGIIAGFGLLNLKSWARILTIVLSALNLPNVPFGTALGAYGLWVMLSQQTENIFAAANRH